MRRKGRADSPGLLFPAAIAVIDAELGIILRLTSYVGDKPVDRSELRDPTTDLGDFRPAMPADLPVIHLSWQFPVDGRAGFSAWMTSAARRALRVRDGLAAVAEWEAEHGAT
jgi:hypothetical protein